MYDAVSQRISGILEQRDATLARVSRKFFGQRGALALPKDRSQHRRYAYLYEDLLT